MTTGINSASGALGRLAPAGKPQGILRTAWLEASPRWLLWVGRGFSAFAGLGLLASAALKFSQHPAALEGMTHYGFASGLLLPLAVLELSCVLLYLLPRTAMLGAILTTAYLGGAVATHVRLEESFVAPVLLGVLVWLGLWLRDARLHQLAPFVSPQRALPQGN